MSQPMTPARSAISSCSALVVLLGFLTGGAFAAACDPSAADYTGRRGKTIHVSKHGDDSDGSSWAKAFHTIQQGLQAVPDDQGGHRVIVRPDTYAEANLYPSHKGAPGAYNVLMGDADGSLGSGATGWVVVDTGAPEVIVRTDHSVKVGNPPWKILETGDPKAEWGLKSVDWWGMFKCDPKFSCEICDRWVFRNLYMCGAEGGSGWDLTFKKGSPFSVIMEDCVGVGRFAGICVGAHVGRPDEPVVFRRSYFMCMDWWGDAAGAYVRAENPKPHDYPDAVFEDCTLVGPDNALQAGNPGFDGYTRVKIKDCRLIVLNFSQPHGQPSTGVIYSTIQGKFLHVDIEDSVLMGYKIFGAGGKQYGSGERPDGGPISYALKGKVQAYVHYRQPVPEGMERLRFWPVDVFQHLLPPGPPVGAGKAAGGTSARPELTRLPFSFHRSMENTPFMYEGRPLIALNHRDDTKNKTDEYTKSMYLYLLDLRTGDEVARFGEGHSFVSAFVNGKELNVFASQGTNRDWFQSIYRFSTTDLKTWKRELAIPLEGKEHLFNCSVCRDEQGYVMAYESNLPRQWVFRFARSKDLSTWEKVPGLLFMDPTNMCACPALRYFSPHYYVIYTHECDVRPGQRGWVPMMARSKDLITWELSPFNPMLTPGPGEGTNNSDVDLFEMDGKTYVYYATGDQATWGNVRVAEFGGGLKAFFESYFPEGAPMVKVSTRRE